MIGMLGRFRGQLSWSARCHSTLRTSRVAAVNATIALLSLGAVRGQVAGAQMLVSPTRTIGIANYHGQASKLDRLVSLNADRARLADVLEKISREGQVALTYRSDEIAAVKRRVSFHGRSVPLRQVFDAVLNGTGLTVHMTSSGQFYIGHEARRNDDPAVIVGHVKDATSGAPVVGATITLDDMERGTITGDSGEYRLTGAKEGKHWLTVRRIGYQSARKAVEVRAGETLVEDFALRVMASTLNQVVVTGTIVPTEVRQLPTPISVFTAHDVEQRGITRVDQLFRGVVPGAIAVDQGTRDGNPGGITFRGGLNFNQTYSDAAVKTYVDGVELAYTNAISQIDVNTIDHIEITRGPEASTLYGAGAIAGVIQIFTKKGAAGTSRPRINAQAAIGVQQSQWHKSVLTQEHSLGVTGADHDLQYNLTASYVSTGPWVPEYQSRRTSVHGGAQEALGPVTVSVTALYSHRRYDQAQYDPYYINAVRSGAWHTTNDAFVVKPFNPDNTRADRTYSAKVTYAPVTWWQNHLTVGYDAYDNPRGLSAPRFLTPSDSLRAYSEFDVARANLQFNTAVAGQVASNVTGSLTAGFERWYSHETNITGSQHADNTFASGTVALTRRTYGNTGYFAQTVLTFFDALAITAGIRADRNDNFGGSFGTAWAPRAGLAYTHQWGNTAVKVRGSYGKAIRAPNAIQKAELVTAAYEQVGNPNLGPESQSGFDGGADVSFGDRGSVEVTYYHQHTDDLISSITLSAPTDPFFRYEWENVGRIKNTGWEFQGDVALAAVQLSGVLSIMNSTVDQIAAAAEGDAKGQYHLGDRLLLVPRLSGGLTLAYHRGGTRIAVGPTYVGAFRNYDMIAMNNDLLGGGTYRGTARAYLIDYPAALKWNVNVSQRITGDASAFVRVDNLTNSYRSEVDNISAVYGRRATAGVRIVW